MKVEYINISEILPYTNNARTHSEEQIKKIASSIKEFGFNNPILLDKDNIVIAGHGRLEAAKKIKIKEVPCIRLEHLTEAQKKAYILADNRLAEIGTSWDEELLSFELEGLKDLDFDIGLTGFDDSFLNEPESEGLCGEDEIPEEVEPVCKLGDIWQLGEHRLMCGDSTSIEAVEKLMAGQKADMVFTDPPYGINEKGDRSKREGACQGNKFKDFVDDSIQYAVDAYNICDELGIKRQVWWGANYYCHFLPQSNNWFVWDKRVEEKQKDTQSDCELAWVKSEFSSIRIFRHLWKGICKDSEHGIKRVHPTQKPVALAEWAFDYFKSVNSVLDLFLGSGSTLIACEKTNRKCYGMELDPHYCDVIIKRWEDYTGKKAEFIENIGQA